MQDFPEPSGLNRQRRQRERPGRATAAAGAQTQSRETARHAPGDELAPARWGCRHEQIDADLQQTQPRRPKSQAGPIELAPKREQTTAKLAVMDGEAAPRVGRVKQRGRQDEQNRQPGPENEQADRGARQQQGSRFETKTIEPPRALEVLERGDTDLRKETTGGLRKDERLGQRHQGHAADEGATAANNGWTDGATGSSPPHRQRRRPTC